MNVYVEYVVIDNMAFDSLLLYCAAKTLKLPVSVPRILCAAAVGTVCAFASTYVEGFWLVFLKIACVFPMCFLAVGFRRLFWYILLFAAYTFALGGVIIGLFHLFSVEFTVGARFGYYAEVPLGLYIAAVFLFVLLMRLMYRYLHNVRAASPCLVGVRLYIGNEVFHLTGYTDSGNVLCYGDTPVCFAVGRFRKIFSGYLAEKMLKKETVRLNYITMGGEASAYAFKCRLEAKGVEKDVYLALPKGVGATEYEILLNNRFSEVCCEKTASA